nr:hypothetical protein CFP56_48263 [Quercus suber]
MLSRGHLFEATPLCPMAGIDAFLMTVVVAVWWSNHTCLVKLRHALSRRIMFVSPIAMRSKAHGDHRANMTLLPCSYVVAVAWCCGLVYMTTCKWWRRCKARQALYLCIELPDVLPISVVPSVIQCLRHNSAPYVAYYLKAFALLVDSFLVNAHCEVSTGPQNHPCVPRVPRGSHIAVVDHVGVLMAYDVEHYVGSGPLAPFANVPTEHHHSALHDCHACPCPSLL